MGLLTTARTSSATVRAEAGLVYDILTDYDNYLEWLPRLAKSKELAREGDLALAEFELAAPERGRLVVECIHTRNKGVLWRAIEGEAPVSEAQWTIGPASIGESQVTLEVKGAAGWRRLFSRQRFLEPAACLQALQAQVSTFMPEIALTDAEGERILELLEGEDGVVCWIRGKKYVLKADSEAEK